MSERGTLREEELVRSELSLIDEAGTVFFQGDRVLRAVRPAMAARMRALLASGLTDALAGRGWIPRCQVADVTIPGFALVIEQERLPVVTYPYEWTYGMARDAAVRVLDINELAREYGWELKDCHGFNLVFHGSEPVWVDLGSFVPLDPPAPGWIAAEQFLRCHVYPLRIWADGSAFVARRLQAAAEPMTHADYGLYRHPWLRWGMIRLYQRMLTRWHQFRQLSRMSEEHIRLRAPAAAPLLLSARAGGWLPAQHFPSRRWRARLLGRRPRPAPGFWSGYQAGEAFTDTPRFRRVAELLQRFQATTVMELAGNQGRLAEELLRRGVAERVTVTDSDETAVNAAYERAKAGGVKLHTAVLDLIFPMVNPFGTPPAQRLRSDAVLALAVTHHLLLTQGLPLPRVLQAVAAYSSRLVFVEFMPLGLWDGRTAPPVPAWYTLDWFRAEFGRQFRWLHDEPVETNRHLFCGEVREAALPPGP